MSYIINNSRGQVVAVVPDGTVNTTSTNLSFVGRGLTSYGEYQNENYMYLLENFANSSAPLQPVLGQLWYNSSTDEISAYNTSNSWTVLASQDYVQAQKISPALTGVPTAPTAAVGTATAQIATTNFVKQSIDANNANLTGANISYSNVSNSVLTDVAISANSTAVTASVGTATTQIATTAFVINQLQGNSPINTGGNIAGGNILTSGLISAAGSVTASGVNTQGNVIALGNISAGGNIVGSSNISGGNLQVSGSVIGPLIQGSTVSSTGNVVAVNISGSGNLSVSGNVVGQNITTSGSVTANVLTANTIVASSIVTTGTSTAFRLPNLTQSQIDVLSGQNGDMVYNTSTNLPQIYQNGVWKNFTIGYYS